MRKAHDARLAFEQSIRRVERVGAPMTTIQAVFFGIMLALTPSMVVLALLLWREGIGLGEDKEAGSRDLYSS
jgi:hypothetical protein